MLSGVHKVQDALWLLDLSDGRSSLSFGGLFFFHSEGAVRSPLVDIWVEGVLVVEISHDTKQGRDIVVL